MMVYSFTSKWRLQQVIEEMSQTSCFPLKHSLIIPKTSMPLVWNGQRKYRQCANIFAHGAVVLP